jgi:hypothetical protein
MTWLDYSLARQYLVETRIGTRIRQAKRDENAQAQQAKDAISRRR